MNKMNNIGLSRELTSCYDFQGFTEQEVWSRIAQKINIIIDHYNYIDSKIENEKENNKIKLEYLLNEGLEKEVKKEILKRIEDGTITKLVNEIIIDINNKIAIIENNINTINTRLDILENDIEVI